MKLAEVVETSRQMAETRSRLEKARLLSQLLAKAPSSELPLVVSYLSGRLPQGRIGIGHQTLGAMRAPRGVTNPVLNLQDVHDAFSELDNLSGAGSSARRAELLRNLLERATQVERDFLVRLLLEDLRQGSLEGVMVEALAMASSLEVESVRRAFMLSGDLAIVAKTARAEGEAGLANIAIELFRPVRSMLAATAEDIADALRTLGVAALEYKLDGARIQVHKSKDRVRVYSRRLNDVTDACPEIVEAIQSLPSKRLVLDGEAVALRADGRPHAFQTTMRRFGRRLDVAVLRRALPLTPIYFDCILLDEEILVDERYEKRVVRLHEALPKDLVVPRVVTAKLDEAQSFTEEALLAGHEGVMAKALDAPYQAGSRGKAWLKVKSAHTLDLVVLAAEWGSGRRRGWLSNLHLGARDPETGGFVMLGKTFKGMTDEILKWQTERLQELEVSRDEWTVRVRPELVVEIAFNDIQKSPHYAGGLALRFARLKAYREDKRVEEADTIDTVRALYEKQTGETLAPAQTQLSLFGDE